ncbi:MAG: hypothetical protein ACR2QO_01245 [Acidimicrobiales bacterium]
MVDPSARRVINIGLLVLPLLLAGAIVWLSMSDRESPTVDVEAIGPEFTSIEELAEASQLIVTGTIVDATPGRVLTDPNNPDVGIRTTIFTLDVAESTADDAGDTITIEYETSLLDGTPTTIDGIAPPVTGETGLYFLIAGPSDDYPHHAIVNHQGRYLLQDDRTLTALSPDALSQAVAESYPFAIDQIDTAN